jgi:hypothetical protein
LHLHYRKKHLGLVLICNSLAFNEIGDLGAREFAALLSTNSTLSHLL